MKRPRFLLGGVMARLPLSALAGVLMVTAWRMNDWEGIRYIFRHKFKSGISQFLITMLATVVFDLRSRSCSAWYTPPFCTWRSRATSM